MVLAAGLGEALAFPTSPLTPWHHSTVTKCWGHKGTGSHGWPWGRQSLKPANKGMGDTVTLHNQREKHTPTQWSQGRGDKG